MGAEEVDPEKRERDCEARALRLLGRREHSRSELWHKLARREPEPSVVDRVLDHLEAQGWLSDERFAEIYARQRLDAGFGPLRIRAELEQRGVSSTPAALEGVDETTWCRMALKQRRQRFGLSGDLDWKEKGRQGRFLAQRGFSMSQIERALGASDTDEELD